MTFATRSFLVMFAFFFFLLTVTFSFPNFRLFISVCYLKILACNDVALCNLCDFPDVVVFILVVVVDVVVEASGSKSS